MHSSWLPGRLGNSCPIVAVAVFLSTNGAFLGLVSLVLIGGIPLLFTFIPRLARHQQGPADPFRGEHATSQTSLRWTLLLFLLCW